MAKPTDADIVSALERDGPIPPDELTALREQARAAGHPLLPFLMKQGRIDGMTAVRVVAAARRRATEVLRFGAYHIREELGRGAMGVVYSATHSETGQPVALKVLKRADDRQARQRFLREAHVLAQLEHPAIPRVHTVLEEPHPAIVMELVEGQRLTELLADPEVPVEVNLRHLLDLARTLAFLHEAGVVHRDLKPDNLLVTPQGIKVIDFGLAHDSDERLTRLTQTGWVLGTPRYMAPEQLHGALATPAFDIWALGVMLIQAATRHHPWELDEHVLETADLGPVPRDLLYIADRAMAHNPRGRYATADDLADDLEGFLEGVSPRRAPMPEHPILVLLAASAVVAVGVLILFRAPTIGREPSAQVSAVPSRVTAGPTPSASPAPEDPDLARASPLVRAGLKHFRAADYEQAAREFRAATEADPQDALAWVLRGECARLRGSGHHQQALAHYESALLLRDDLWRAYEGRAGIALQRGDPKSALTLLGRAIELAPQRALTAYLERYALLMRLGRRGEAKADIDALFRVAPRLRHQWHLSRAAVHLEAGDLEACERDALEGRRLGGRVGEAHLLLAAIRISRRDYAGARDVCTEGISLDPKLPHLFSSRAEAHLGLGANEAVIRDADQALTLANDPANLASTHLDGISRIRLAFGRVGLAKCLGNKGTALRRLGRNAEARAAFDQALSLNRTAGLLVLRGNLSKAERRFQEALVDLGMAAVLAPRNALVFANRGSLYRAVGRNELAKTDFDRALKLDPDNVMARINRANLFVELKQLHAAERDLLAAIKASGGKAANAYNSLAVVRLRQRRLEPALQALDQSLKLLPTDAETWKNKGIVLDRLGRQREALDSLLQARKLGLKSRNLDAAIAGLRKRLKR